MAKINEGYKIVFIGCGAMGEAILKGMLGGGLVKKEQVTAAVPTAKRQAYLQETYGIAVTGDNSAAVKEADLVILAVKPQMAKTAVDQALVDALPVFGTGTVLLPWAVLALLGGDVRMSVGLLVLYSVISLVRSLLEPRLVGARVGLPPLAALVCMYVGFQALGVLGMLLAPLAAVLARQLWDSGLLHSLFGP